MKYEVLVADDHAIIRDGLRKILADTDDLVVAGEAANGNQALERCVSAIGVWRFWIYRCLVEAVLN